MDGLSSSGSGDIAAAPQTSLPAKRAVSPTPGKANKKFLSPLEQRPAFEVRPMHISGPPHPYNSETDPNNPFTRTAKYHKHMVQMGIKTEGATGLLMSKSMSHLGALPPTATTGSLAEQFNSSMVEMPRAPIRVKETFPRTQVQNTSLATGGVTFSVEPSGNAEESKAELEILKAVLNREGYLNRLEKAVRTINKKFKPEVSDILDLVRAATIEVVECIVKWREAKRDHSAAFMWNKTNYLLKMASDLDYLHEYLAVRKWMGFTLIRNPFCIPLPLEEGVGMFGDRVLNPKHIESGQQADGFMIGGLSQQKLRSTYTPSASAPSSSSGAGRSKGSRPATQDNKDEKDKAKPSPYAAPAGFLTKAEKELVNESQGGGGLPSSFVMNSDMAKIRQAELVLLKEEEKFGKWSRDPTGRLVPSVQAYTRIATIELRRDDRRPLDQPAVSEDFAPHALNSDVGILQDVWLPPEREADRFANSSLIKQFDDDVNPTDRGRGTSGGILSPITLKGVQTRPRRPMRIQIGSAIEFNRYRRKKTIGDRLQEISKLREQIKMEREALEAEKIRIRTASRKESERSPKRKPTSGSFSAGGQGNIVEGGLQGTVSPPPSRAGASRGSVSFDLGGAVGLGPLSGAGETGDEPFSPANTNATTENDAFENESVGSNFTGMSKAERDREIRERREAQLEKVRVRERDLQVKLETALEEDKNLRMQLDHINKDEITTNQIKASDHRAEDSERSREIERKRRLLTPQEGQRKGPPRIEEANAYDYYATRCQSALRGWITRCYTKWYREASRKAARSIQAVIRGKLARMKVKRKKYANVNATLMQKTYRGYKARNVSAKMAKSRNLAKGVIKIQKIYRGVLGRRRAVNKKELDLASEAARASVDPRNIFVSDVKELARRIQYAIEEPETSTYPPDEVLQLLRLSTIVMQQSRGQLGISEYSFINARYYYEVDGETMTWNDSVKMLNRSERVLRMMRSLAFGPAAKPPRIVQLSATSKLSITAASASPNWRRETFENMGMGCKFCLQLFDWLENIATVSSRQSEFLGFLASSFPDWLPKLYDIQALERKADFEMEVSGRCIKALEEIQSRSADDPKLVELLEKDRRRILSEVKKYSDQTESYQLQQKGLMKSQENRESLALVGTEVKLENTKKELETLTQEYRALLQSDDSRARERIGAVRVDLINMELQVKEVTTQLRLMNTQVDSNGVARLETNRLPLEIRIKAQAAGEALALDLVSVAKIATFLDDAGVRHADHLADVYIPLYENLEALKTKAHSEYWTSYRAVDAERKVFDSTLTNKLKQMQIKEIESRESVRPTDEEMEEERREDEKTAVEERLKKIQYVPDAALFHAHPNRPRPVIIGLGRDLPGNAKQRILQEVTKMMPGMFIFLDHPTNMGLCLQDMQAALDAKKCIIMMVDHGLCRMTRMGFLKSFEVTVRALIPNPFVVMAIGDDWNRRGSGGSHYGTFSNDLQNMRDYDVKAAMETLGWCIHEFQKPEITEIMIRLSAEVVPPSQSFVTVMEGFFILQSGSEDFSTPDVSMAALSWRFTQRLLADPRGLAHRLLQHKRGSSTVRLTCCLARYIANDNWPLPNSQERSDDKLMNLFALYVEAFVQSEQSTIERGGVPPQAISRTSMKGIQAVEVVTDTANAEDTIHSSRAGGWRMTAAKLVRVAMQDLRTLKTVLRVGSSLLNVCAYREGELVYLDTYDSTTSATHVCALKLSQIAFLLVPNASMSEKGHVPPPQTPPEMYTALAKLLKFEPYIKSRADSRLHLVCRREYTFLKQVNTKLNGHTAFIKCFEAALGQLYFQAYLPAYSAVVSCLVADRARLSLIENADPHYEFHVVEDNDARKLLPYAIDRLKISPNASMVKVARGGPDLMDGYRKTQGKDSALQAQGFAISMRVRGGCGKIMSRKIRSFSGVPHLVEIRIMSETKLLIVSAYEPRARHVMRVTLKPFYRRLLLHSDSGDPRVWMSKLLGRLKIDWRGHHELVVDRTMLRVVRKIAGQRLVLSIGLADEDHVKIGILDQSISMNFSALINKEELIRLLLYSPPLDVIEKQFGVKVNKPGVRAILQNAKTKNPNAAPAPAAASAADTSSSASGEKDLHPSTFDVSLESVLAKHDNLTHLANQLSAILVKIRADSQVFGFKCTQPVEFEIIPVAQVQGKIEFDTKVRFEPRLKQSPREPTVAGLLRSRRQMPFTIMEDELNLLAVAKAEATERELAAIIAANKEVEQHFLGLSESDYNELAGVPPDTAENTILSDETKEELQYALAEDAASLVADSIIDTIEERERRRQVEREMPGTTQEVRRLQIMSGAGDGTEVIEIDANLLSAEDREILGRGEKMVFEGGVKTQFRDTKAVWAGHVAIKVFETVCWQGSDGLGRRLRFEVYEPSSAGYYDGLIRNNLHLKGIVGRHGFDMLVKSRLTELIMFISKYKMFVCDNTISWDGEPNSPGSPAYRIEFETERIYTEDKITPVNANTEVDDDANKKKLFESELKRGIKISRLVRRISSLLMQLTVFEIKTTPEDAEDVAKSPYGHDPLDGKSEEELLMMAGGAGPGAVNFAALNPQRAGTLPGGECKAEERNLTTMKKYVPPTFRVVGYDPKSKKKVICICTPSAILEIAGGVYSPFLDPARRRELAKIVTDALGLEFPKNKPFELVLQWSGAGKAKVAADIVLSKVKSTITRSSAELVLKKTNRLFRAACKIGKIECLVTLYLVDIPKTNSGDGRPPERQLIVNLYSRSCSDAAEIMVTAEEQIIRVGRPLGEYPDGDVRTAAIRRFLRFIKADLIDDPKDPDDPKPPKLLHALLLPPGKDFHTEYKQVREGVPGEEVRPIGCPTIFMPPNTLGKMLHRRGMTLEARTKDAEEAPFVVTVYTVNENVGPERGLILRIYDKNTCETAVMHLGSKEIQRLCDEAGENDLLRDTCTAIQGVNRIKLDKQEEAFEVFTERGSAAQEAKKLTDLLVDIVLRDLGFDVSPTEHLVPFIKSIGRGNQVKYD